MTTHPHAEVLRAIADGVPLDEFEVHGIGWVASTWDRAEPYSRDWIAYPGEWAIRRKPRTIKVNGFDVPEPCKDTLALGVAGSFYLADVYRVHFYSGPITWGDDYQLSYMRRGLVHLTKEAAIAHAKAMLNINPKEAA